MRNCKKCKRPIYQIDDDPFDYGRWCHLYPDSVYCHDAPMAEPEWQPGDPCALCDSTRTYYIDPHVAACMDCGATDYDE